MPATRSREVGADPVHASVRRAKELVDAADALVAFYTSLDGSEDPAVLRALLARIQEVRRGHDRRERGPGTRAHRGPRNRCRQ